MFPIRLGGDWLVASICADLPKGRELLRVPESFFWIGLTEPLITKLKDHQRAITFFRPDAVWLLTHGVHFKGL